MDQASFRERSTATVITADSQIIGLLTQIEAAGGGTSTVAITDVTGLGAGVSDALTIAVGGVGSVVVQNGVLGTPLSGTVTNLTGTASININGTVGATTPGAGTFTTGTLNGKLVATPQALSAAGAIDVVTTATDFTSTGGSQALTLANGTVGQIKTITHIVDGGSGVLTPTTKTGFSTITFTNAGDSVTLRYCTTAGWCVIGSFGVTIA